MARHALGFTLSISLALLAPCANLAAAGPERDQALIALRTGTSDQRRPALELLGRTVRPNDEPAVLEALIAATTDPAADVRNRAMITIGRNWIWNAPRQDARAIETAIRLAGDPSPEVRYNAVYYGLSTAKDKTDAVINAMLRAGLALDEYDHNIHGRIAWGLRQSKVTAQRLGPLFEPLLNLDGAERNKAMIAYGVYVEATGEEPPRPERFAADEFLVRFLASDAARLDADALLAEFRRVAPQDMVIEAWANNARSGTWGAAIVKGSAARRQVMQKLAASETIVPATWVMPASKAVVARLREGMKRDEAALAEAGAKPEAKQKPQVDDAAIYADAFQNLYDHLGRAYPAFEIKKIDWKKVGEELLPKSKAIKDDEEFGRLCLQLVARLEDSHAMLQPGTARVPQIELPQFDPGFACVIDDRDRPVVYTLDADSPAQKAGIKPGMAVVSVNGKPAADALAEWMKRTSMYYGYSSDRVLRYDAARMFVKQMSKGTNVKLVMEDAGGKQHAFDVPATLGVRYLPRLPIPIDGIKDSADVSWKKLEDGIGYVYVRRIRNGLEDALDAALREFGDARGLIIDVRGNTGGGFDERRALRNFDTNDGEEPLRPRYGGPIALLIDEHTISAGEGWASWFVANQRAKLFGTATAGASSRKSEYTLTNGLYKVVVPVKAYTGFLDRPIERRGIEPDVPVRVSAKDIAAGRDTVLEAAREHLLKAPAP